MEVIWSEKAKESLAGIYDYIYPFSPENAERVIDTLLEIGDSLGINGSNMPKSQLFKRKNTDLYPNGVTRSFMNEKKLQSLF